MEIKKTEIEGLVIVEPKVFGDNRGWFTETYSKKLLDEATGGTIFVQDNHSMSAKKGTLRGLHYQCAPMAQAKLVRCTNGAIIDVAVDVRRSSPTFMKWVAVELTAANFRQLFLPKGFLAFVLPVLPCPPPLRSAVIRVCLCCLRFSSMFLTAFLTGYSPHCSKSDRSHVVL